MSLSPSHVLHPRLAADTVEVARWPLCGVLLMQDANWPWLILVPARPGLREIHQLPAPDRAQLMEEIARASAGLERLWQPDKVNVGALGNLVPQLHIHVIARFADDPAWPGPVWAAPPPRRPYASDELESILTRLREGL